MNNLLEKIDGPADLKRLSMEELGQLAEQIRQMIIETVSRTGGHLASNLGIVELTLAMHYVFDFKHDKLLWDVGHQCYAHKIITGRKRAFNNLRQADGLSGFPSPCESEYDHFAVGHAGTAIATAIGMAIGQAKTNKNDKIIAMVGDASIVNGTSFEGLNNLGLVKRQLLVVFNDNSMAIDATEGAVARYFSKVRLSHTYEDLRKTTKNILERMPVFGKEMEEAIERVKKTIRMVLPASQMFESLHLPYFGPVDGHDISSLVQLFEAMKHLDRPAILHVYTKKGKGFSAAAEKPSKFHSTGPFAIKGEAVLPAVSFGAASFTNVFGDHLLKLAEEDERIVAITSAMCEGTGLEKFREKFPERFYDVGIAESAAVDIAAGLAKTGLKPVVCIYSTFLQRCFDHIFQEVSLQNLPVVFCIDRAGLVGQDGPTHHGMMDIGFLRMMPNVVLTSPADDAEMELALEFALRQNNCVCIRYPKEAVAEDVFDRSACKSPFELGKGVVVRGGRNSPFAIVSYGSILTEALKAAEMLGKEGLEVDVINARFASPVDTGIIGLGAAGKGIITVEDHYMSCGFGSAVLEEMSALPGGYRGSVIVLGAPKMFIKQGLRASQFNEAGINADKIVEMVKRCARLNLCQKVI